MHRGLTGSHKMLADWQSWHDVILADMYNNIQADIFVLNNGCRLLAMHQGLTGSHKMPADGQPWHYAILATMCNSIQADIYALNNGWRQLCAKD